MLVIALIVCAVGWPIAMNIPNTYEVSAKVHLDTQTILKPLLEGLAVDSNLIEATALVLQKTLLNRPNLEKVIRAVDLDLTAVSQPALDEQIRKLALNIEFTQMRIPVQSRRVETGGGVFEISYRDEDPKRAKLVVQEILTLFVESILSATQKDTQFTEQFLNEKIKEYEVNLIAAEERLKDFKRNNVGLMPQEGQSYYSQIASERTRLEEAQLQHDEAVNRRNELKRQLKNVVEAFNNSSNQTVGQNNPSPLETRITTMEARLDELTLQYTESHPDVVSTRRIVEDLYKQRTDQKKNNIDERETQLLESNPVYQELKVDLGGEEAQVAALEVRVRLYRHNLRALQDKISTIPKVEAELAKLNRDYGIIREHYEGLVQRRESAKLSFDAENKDGKVNFKIIDPPVVPITPISPNRPLLITGVLIAGIFGGIGLVILLMQLRPTFSNRQDFVDVTELPVFGTVSKVILPNELTKQKIGYVMFSLLALSVLVAYGGLIAMQLNIIKV